MKILQINKFLKNVGGAETYMFQLSKSLKDRSMDVKFWGMYDKENLVQDFPELLAYNIDYGNQGIFKKISSVKETIYSVKNRKNISQVLDIFKPDIVHIHNYNFQLSPSILPEIKKRNIPIVQTIHDSQMVCPYHRLFNFQRNETCTKCVEGSFINCIKDRCFDGSLFKSTVGAAESMLYHSLGYYNKFIDAYISPSNFLANLIKKRINKEIQVIPNFTTVSIPTNPISPTENFYLYYGRISDEKGILELTEIFKKIKLKLIIIGKGALEEELSKSIAGYGNIEFLGPKYGEELFNYIVQAKYVIQPSKWFENCPMTIIESFSLGVPVIGSNHSGFKDLIVDGKTGFLFDFSNDNKVLEKFLEIDNKPIDQLKENVKTFYDKNLSPDIHIHKIISVYENLLNK
ncbi:MAG TPA: glycosyltransferase [Mangrovimonas sp.]|nr:glycosyltransferase [Mangrovimonas sp.]